jgi:hypothetical protein
MHSTNLVSVWWTLTFSAKVVTGLGPLVREDAQSIAYVSNGVSALYLVRNGVAGEQQNISAPRGYGDFIVS